MQGQRFRADAVEFHPGAAPRSFNVTCGILLILCMNPYPRRRMHALLLKHCELFEGRHRRSGMCSDRETGLEVRNRSRVDQFLLHFAERTAVKAEFDETWTYARSVDPPCPLIDPTLGESLGGEDINPRRKVFVIISGVVSSHCKDMESALF